MQEALIMKAKINFPVKLLLSLLIYFGNFYATLMMIVLYAMLASWNGILVIAMMSAIMGLTIFLLYLVYKRNPLKNKVQKAIYWSFPVLYILAYFWFFFTWKK
jgi:hypothetical protein